jgi:phosphatidylserine/phosphatidylglycerophosphate/cardiolipin synthase-like enzyme
MIKIEIMLLLLILSGCSSTIFEEVDVVNLDRVLIESSLDLYMCPQDDCLNVVLSFLNTAEESIYCAFYELDQSDISNLLIEKHLGGVNVALVVDDGYLEEQSILGLNKVGVDVMSDLKRGTKYNNYMHHKFCIVDGSKLLLSSANPSENGMFYNNNNILLLDSVELAKEFGVEFNQLYSGVFGQNKNQNRNIKGVSFENGTLDVYLCPQDSCELALVDVLDSAREEIFFANFVLTLDSAEEILIEKNYLGVNVSGLIETRMFNSKGSRAKELEKLFPLVRDTNPKTMHHKFFVVDSRYVVTGSMNPSSSGVNYNDEFLIIIDSEEIALQYREEFLSLISE